MNATTTEKQPIFKTAIIAMLVCLGACLIYAGKGDKKREAFKRVGGTVLAIDSAHESYPGKDPSKFRFLTIDSYPQAFELFIGKSSGDFSPEYDDLSQLHEGDNVDVYFEETAKSQREAVNKLVYYIDKNNEPVFRQGNSKKGLAYGMAIFSGLVIIGLLILKGLKKIR